MTTVASKRRDLHDQRIPGWPGRAYPTNGTEPTHTITPINWIVMASDDVYYQLKSPATGEIVWFYSIDLDFDERETVDLTPSWQGITGALLNVYRTVDKPEVLRDIEEEFARMARLADKYVEEHQ